MLNLGTVRPGSTIYIPFDTFAGATGASITMSGLAVGDIKVYKDGGTTERASTAGYTLLDTDGIDFDGVTGIHGFSLNLADDTTADFWAAGSKYFVVVDAITVDAQTVKFIAATFEIGYPDAILNTTIAALTSQTVFTLTAGPAENNAIDGCVVCLHDKASAVQLGFAVISGYTGATKTVTLLAGATFTVAVGDNISIFPPVNIEWVGQVAQTGGNLKNTMDVGFAGAATVGDVAVIPQAVWDEALPGAFGAGTAGKLLADTEAAVDTEMAAVLEDTGTTLDDLVDDLESRLTAVLATALQAHSLGVGRGVVGAGSTTTAVKFGTVNGVAADGTDDHYNGRHIVFTSGALLLQQTSITDYTGATTTATVPALTEAPAQNDTFIIV